MTSRRLALLLLVLAPVAAGQILDENNRWIMKYRLEKGQRFKYRNTIERRREWAGPWKMTEVNEEMEEWLLEVVQGGLQPRIELKVIRYRVDRYFEGDPRLSKQIGGPMARLTFDSEGLSVEELAEVARREPRLDMTLATLFKPYVVKIDVHGEVLEVESMGEFASGLGPIFEEAMGEKGRQMFQAWMASGEAERRMAEGVRIAFAYLPTKPVDLTDTWEQRWSRNVAPIGRIDEKATLRLDEVDVELAKISYVSDTTHAPIQLAFGAMPDWYKATASELRGSGKIVFDLQRGILVRLDAPVRFRLDTEMPIPAEERPPAGELPEISQIITDTRTLELIEVLPPR